MLRWYPGVKHAFVSLQVNQNPANGSGDLVLDKVCLPFPPEPVFSSLSSLTRHRQHRWQYYSTRGPSPNLFSGLQVLSARKQLVAGTLYFLTLQAVEGGSGETRKFEVAVYGADVLPSECASE